MSAIANQAILVELNISVWTSRKRDKTTSNEVLAEKQATSKSAASVIKSLFADEPKLTAIVNTAQSIRAWHYANTLPWTDTGIRLLPMENFINYKRGLSEWEAKFDAAVADFLSDYPTLVTAAAFRLGKLFSRSEYPPVNDVRRKFSLSYVFSPVPTAGDFRVTAQSEELEELRKQYEENERKRVEAAAKENWNNLYECLQRLSTQLGFDQGKKKRVYQSMFDSAKGLTGMLTALNVTNDPALEAARKELETALAGIDAEDVRKHEAVRDQAKRSIDGILTTYKDNFTNEDENGLATEQDSVEAEVGDAYLNEREGPFSAVEADDAVSGTAPASSADNEPEFGVGAEAGEDTPAPRKPDLSLLDF